MATEKQPTQSDTGTTKATAAMKNAAKVKLRTKDLTQLVYDTTKVIAPLWFALQPVKKAIHGLQLRPETALCLILHGANNESSDYSSILYARRALLAWTELGLDDVDPIAHLGTYSLFGGQLAKFAIESEGKTNEDTAHVVLTKKGQNLYALAKESILKPPFFDNL